MTIFRATWTDTLDEDACYFWLYGIKYIIPVVLWLIHSHWFDPCLGTLSRLVSGLCMAAVSLNQPRASNARSRPSQPIWIEEIICGYKYTVHMYMCLPFFSYSPSPSSSCHHMHTKWDGVRFANDRVVWRNGLKGKTINPSIKSRLDNYHYHHYHRPLI